MSRGPARALIAAGCAVMLAFWLGALACSGAFDYAEGDTATWIWLARHGHALYAPLGGLPMLSSNYPPIQLALVAALAPSDGTILLVGRLLSLAGFALTMAMVGLSVSAATRSRAAGLWSALLLAATCVAGYHAVVCRADALALGLGAAGVTLCARRVRGWPVLAAIAFTLSLLCKHNLIVLPGGAILWALWREPRRGVVLAASTGGLLALAIWRLHLWTPLVAWSIAGWGLVNFLRYLGQAVAPSLFGVWIAIWALRNRARFSDEARRVLEPWAVVLALSAAWWLALGRTGSSANYLLEYETALVVVIAIAVAAGAPRRLFHAHLGFTVVETAAWAAVHFALVFPDARAQASAAQRALAGVDGPILAEQAWQPALMAGKPPFVIPYLATQLAYAHRWDPAPLDAAIAHRDLARVLLGFPLEEPAANNFLHRDRFLPAELDVLRANYRLLTHDGNLYVYGPR
jgi:hypothetical protein